MTKTSKFSICIFSIKRNIIVFLVFVVLCSAQKISGQTIVSSIAALQSTINSASSGATIALADGTYSDAILSISKTGITVRALNSGKVIFNGTSRCVISGNDNTFSGFQYKNGDIGIGEVVEVKGNNNTITQCNFSGVVAKNYINFDSGTSNNKVTYSNFEAKPANPYGSELVAGCINCGNAGPSIQINTSPTVISYSTISRCTFLNFPGNGADFGNEAIRIGLGAEQNNTSASIVEYCYFENTGPGDSESISVKSRYNVLRFNTQRNNPAASFVLRSGNNNSVYSNFFINSGGVRIKEGTNHMVYNNYFEGAGINSSLELRSDGEVQPDTIYIYHNTFYNPGNILLNAGGGGTNIPLNVKFANNIFFKNSGTIFTDSNINASFVSNLYFGGALLGRALIASEFTNTDPALILNSSGFKGLTDASTATFNANGTYTSLEDNLNVNDDPTLTLDIEGQTRPATATQKNIGCDQLTTGTITNKPLAKSEAGPNTYLTSQTITFDALPPKSVSDIDFSPGATSSSGLTISYASSNTAVATIINGNIHIIAAGTSTITASQAGNDTFNAATPVDQTLIVNKVNQTIAFATLPSKYTDDPDFSPVASASSGLPITYSSSNSLVATIVSNQIHINGPGTCVITATQVGNASYNAATATKNLTVICSCLR